jgi:hypothetical protein
MGDQEETDGEMPCMCESKAKYSLHIDERPFI